MSTTADLDRILREMTPARAARAIVRNPALCRQLAEKASVARRKPERDDWVSPLRGRSRKRR